MNNEWQGFKYSKCILKELSNLQKIQILNRNVKTNKLL